MLFSRGSRVPRWLFGWAAVLLGIGAMLSACTAPWTTTPTPEPHASFGYAKFDSVDVTKDYHPGDVLTFTWDATQEGTVHQANPDDITLQAGLYGPFDTVDALKQQMSSFNAAGQSGATPMSGAALRIDPIRTDSWRNEIYTSTLQLPATLNAGYYSFVRAVTTTSGRNSITGSGQSIIRVVGP